jgi:hypothetical protein
MPLSLLKLFEYQVFSSHSFFRSSRIGAEDLDEEENFTANKGVARRRTSLL